MRLLRVPVALLLSLSLPGVAFAQVPPPPKGPAQPEPEPEPEPELSDEEKEAKAKDLYIKAEGLAAEGNWAEAVPLYEQAYYLVPGKHGFAYKVGIATWKIDDCDKTKEYLTHLVTYAAGEEKYADMVAEAEGILAEIEERQCAAPEPEPEPEPPPTAVDNPLVDTDNPLDPGTTDGGGKKKEKKGLLVGGAVLIALGAGGIGAGAAGVAMASSAGNGLSELSSYNTPTGYPEGDYACRVGECPGDLESKLATGKLIGYVGFAAGGAMLVTGIALIAVHVTKKKKAGGGGASATAPSKVQLSAAGPMLMPGGGGAMAGIRF